MGKAVAGLLVVLAATFAAPAPADAEVSWLCRPGLAENPCEIPRDTTVREHGMADRVEIPTTGRRRVDCFYVYPTVSNQIAPNADKSRDPELESIAKYQAAYFSSQCRIFAPIYRQRTLFALGAGMAGAETADRELAYADVLEAWREYLATANRGRGVVLIGHSQGTSMLRQLLRREIEGNRKQRRLLVSGLLLGGDVTVATGKTVGGDFRRTPICTRRGQFGCVVAFSTFAQDPPRTSNFGTTEEVGLEVACTDPRRLAGSTQPLRILTPSEPFAFGPIFAGIVATGLGLPPSAPTTWVTAPDRFDGACRTINGANVLRIEPRPGSRRPFWYPTPGWGTHVIDVNATLEPLVSLVSRQATRWLRSRG